MSQGNPQLNSPNVAVNIAAVVVVFVESAGLYAIFGIHDKGSSILYSRIAISVIALSFVVFLFGIIKNFGSRSVLVTLIFFSSNIASTILLFANIYKIIGLKDSIRTDSLSTSMWDAIYFSVITWTTVGYGDVIPTLEARSTAVFEAITGYTVMGLLISALVIIAQRDNDG